MQTKEQFNPGDIACAKVGRNIVQVRVAEKVPEGWRVTTRTGKTMLARTLFAQAHGGNRDSCIPAAETGTAAVKTPQSAATRKRKGLSLICAAAKILESSPEPMGATALVAAAREQRLWTPGAGKTPSQTLYSSIIREIKAKGELARFRKSSRGRFVSNR